MWIIVVILALLAVGVIVVVRIALAGRPDRHEPQPESVDSTAAAEFPEPGEPTPLRDDGTPPPGSRADRQLHGDDSAHLSDDTDR